jgi:hypothetical protein
VIGVAYQSPGRGKIKASIIFERLEAFKNAVSWRPILVGEIQFKRVHGQQPGNCAIHKTCDNYVVVEQLFVIPFLRV